MNNYLHIVLTAYNVLFYFYTPRCPMKHHYTDATLGRSMMITEVS